MCVSVRVCVSVCACACVCVFFYFCACACFGYLLHIHVLSPPVVPCWNFTSHHNIAQPRRRRDDRLDLEVTYLAICLQYTTLSTVG